MNEGIIIICAKFATSIFNTFAFKRKTSTHVSFVKVQDKYLSSQVYLKDIFAAILQKSLL